MQETPSAYQIAQYDRVLELVKEVDFPVEQILNYWPEKFFDFLGINPTA